MRIIHLLAIAALLLATATTGCLTSPSGPDGSGSSISPQANSEHAPPSMGNASSAPSASDAGASAGPNASRGYVAVIRHEGAMAAGVGVPVTTVPGSGGQPLHACFVQARDAAFALTPNVTAVVVDFYWGRSTNRYAVGLHAPSGKEVGLTYSTLGVTHLQVRWNARGTSTPGTWYANAFCQDADVLGSYTFVVSVFHNLVPPPGYTANP